MYGNLQQRTAAMRAAGVSMLLALAMVVGAAQPGQTTPTASLPGTAPNDAAIGTASTSPPHKQLVDESAQLLALAVALKGEVDKTNKDMLSLNVIRKADAIEKLAHRLREHLRAAGTAH